MLTAPAFLAQALKQQARRLATCWRIARTDGVVLRLTSHDVELVVGGQTYSPMGGADPSSARRQGQLREHDREFRGVVTSAKITDADLRAGRYDRALVEEYLVDWRFAWAGWLRKAAYWIADLDFDAGTWRAATVGLVRWLQGEVGHVYGRHCRHELGVVRPDGDGCPVNLASFTATNVAATGFGDGARKAQIRAATLVGAQADGYFAEGKLTVVTGPNAGVRVDVKRYTAALGEIELHLPLPHAMSAGDTFHVTAGCDKRVATCRTKFNVFVAGFGGFDAIPGTDFVFSIRPGAA